MTMEIKTRFDVGQQVVTINKDSIVQLPIKELEYSSAHKRTRYTLLVSKAVNFGDPDSTIVKDQDECFESIAELATHYQDKLKIE